MHCYIQENCRAYTEDRCYSKDKRKYCPIYLLITDLYKKSNVPENYRGYMKLTKPGADKKEYKKLKEIENNAFEFIQSGKGIFIHSNNRGNGKTSWSCKILYKYFKHIVLNHNIGKSRALFIDVPSFLQELRNDMDREEKEMVNIKDKIKEVDLVIWDDIGAERASDWVRENLFGLINTRYSWGLSQFFTSNLDIETLEGEDYLGNRIIDRIYSQCEIFEFVEGTRRRE